MFTVVFHAGRFSANELGIALHARCCFGDEGAESATIHGPRVNPWWKSRSADKTRVSGSALRVVHFCGSEEPRTRQLEGYEPGREVSAQFRI